MNKNFISIDTDPLSIAQFALGKTQFVFVSEILSTNSMLQGILLFHNDKDLTVNENKLVQDLLGSFIITTMAKHKIILQNYSNHPFICYSIDSKDFNNYLELSITCMTLGKYFNNAIYHEDIFYNKKILLIKI